MIRKIILEILTLMCALSLFYISNFQKSYLDNYALMIFLSLSSIILILLHIKVYKK